MVEIFLSSVKIHPLLGDGALMNVSMHFESSSYLHSHWKCIWPLRPHRVGTRGKAECRESGTACGYIFQIRLYKESSETDRQTYGQINNAKA